MRIVPVAASLLSLTLAAPILAAPAPVAPVDVAAVDALLARDFPAAGPGAAVLVRQRDRVLLRRGYGLADVELDVPVQPEMVFRLGSVTKQFTAAAILLLVEQGALALTDDVRKYLPDQAPTHGPTITIEALLTHTAGVPNYTDLPGFWKRDRTDLSRAELVATFRDLPLDFAPGERWSYSNSGYFLLGLVIEKVSGKSYADFLDEKIFRPLGMAHTRLDEGERLVPGLVRGYDRHGSDVAPAEPMSLKLPFAAGGLISTVDDLAVWDRAIADGKLLRPESWKRAFTAAHTRDGTSTQYGFGWGVGSWHGHRVLSHGGGIPGFNTVILRLPDDGVLVTILGNELPAPTNLEALALRIAALVIGDPVRAPVAVTLPAAKLGEYTGVYRVDATARVLVRRDGDHLMMGRPGQLHALVAEGDDHFADPDGLPRITFRRDQAGKVTAFDAELPDGATAHRARTDEPLPAALKPFALDEAAAARLCGDYQLAPTLVITVSHEGTRVFIQATGQPRLEAFASSPSELFLTVVDAQLSFTLGAKSPASQLVLHQGGQNLPGARVK